MNGSSLPWKLDVLRLLARSDAPRAFTPPALAAYLERHGHEPAMRTLLRALGEWESAGLLARPIRGSYLNLQATPLPQAEEILAHTHPGAVVSLSTVLGRAGIINNPTHWTTAVVPLSGRRGPSQVESDTGSVFRFAHMRDALVPQPGQDWAADALAPYAHVPTATPEKALLDWIYLAASPRGAARWPLPPVHDWDISDLDPGRLDRLAQRMGLVAELARFRTALEGSAPRVSVRRPRP